MYASSTDTSSRYARYNELLKRTMEAHSHKTGAEYGEVQLPIFRALDFADEMFDGLFMFNICTAKTAYGSTCGLAYPSKLWWQDIYGPTTQASDYMCGTRRVGNRRARGNWSWKRHCEWGYLVKEAYVRGDDSDAAKWVKELTD